MASRGWGPRSVAQDLLDPDLEQRQDLRGEPGVLGQPKTVPGRGVRKDKIPGQVIPEIPDGLGKGPLPAVFEVMALGVLPYEQDELQLGHIRREPVVPQGRTFRAGGQVPGGALARITKSHGDQGKKSGIVKLCLGHPQPVAELLPTGVVPRNPALVHLTPRRLPDNGDPAPGTRGPNGPWPQGQIRLADPSAPSLG